MLRKYLLLISAYGLALSSQHIKKELPPHLREKYKAVDPKKHVFVPTKHNLTDADLKPAPKDPTRRKTHDEIPRVADRHVEVEHLEHHEVLITKDHIEDARKYHALDLKRRKKNAAQDQQVTVEDEKAAETIDDEDDLFEEEWAREEKPENPDHDYLFKMIILVHFRQKFQPEKEDSLHYMGGFIEQDL